MVAVAYVALFLGSGLVHTRPGHRVRSLWRKKHRQHIGSDAQLRGVEGLAPSDIEADCTDVHVHGVEGGPDNVSNVVSPCGLISRI